MVAHSTTGRHLEIPVSEVGKARSGCGRTGNEVRKTERILSLGQCSCKGQSHEIGICSV